MPGNQSREVIGEVLAATDIVDLIGAYLELKPAGAGRFKALCPFHNEKTPSFNVSRDRQTFKCFGCGKGGDGLSFIMEHDGLLFGEALERLAQRAGITLPARTASESRQDGERRQLLELGKFAQKFYSDLLRHPEKGSQGRAYLKTRTLKPETEKRFGLGYVPDGFDHLTKAAREAGYKDEMLESSGLCRRSDRGVLYDFFRNRLMVPIRDVSGNVIAFGGRDLSGTAPGKYVNTPETAAYKKSQVLYGLYEARDAMRQAKQAILVEGYFDAMRLADAGIEQVVASCGTALTSGQARLLNRYVRDVVLVYDGDDAGIKAAMRAVSVLVPEGLTVRVLTLPGGKDPDDFVRDEGADRFRALVESAPDFVRFYIEASRSQLGTIEGRSEVAREVLTVLMMIDDVLRRGEYVKHAAKALGTDPWALQRELEAMTRRKTDRDTAVRTDEPKAPVTFRATSVHRDDIEFVAALLTYGELRALAVGETERLALAAPVVAEVVRELAAESTAMIVQRLDSDAARDLYLSASVVETIPLERAQDLVAKRLNAARRFFWEREDATLRAAISDAERANNQPEAMELMRRRLALRREVECSGAL